MNDEDLLVLTKTMETPNEESIKYISTKKFMKDICKSLSVKVTDYEEKDTIDLIEQYIENESKMKRILYSEISNYVFHLDEDRLGTFISNVDDLLGYTLKKSEHEISEDCRKIVVKIYDHVQLATYQTEIITELLVPKIEEAKIGIHKEISGIEKEYISILGIFASIVLAFVGGITFSSSVLSNINKVSIYKLVLIIDMLGFILMNVIWMLINFITTINEKELKYFNIRTFNKLCLIILIIVILAWMFSIKDLEGFFHGWLPWTNKVMRVLINK